MEHPSNLLLILLVVLLIGRIFGEIANRLNTPAVMGEMLAGVVLGPSLLGWISPTETLRFLAEVGIILMLFKIGLETDLGKLVSSGSRSVAVALGGVLLPLIGGFLVAKFVMGANDLTALFVGGTLTATSIGITVRVLSDLGQTRTKAAQIVLGAAVIDDIIGVVMLAILVDFARFGEVRIGEAGKVILFIGMFLILAPLAAKAMAKVIHRVDRGRDGDGWIPVAIVTLVLFFAWLAEEVGAPHLVGGFAAGIALSRRFYVPMGIALHNDRAFVAAIEKQTQPIIHLFTPIFFVVVGLSLDLSAVHWGDWHIWGATAALLMVASIGKMAVPILTPGPVHERLLIGVAMLPRGEVGLIFAELGRTMEILSGPIYAILILVIALTTLIPPLILKKLVPPRPVNPEPLPPA